MTHPPPDPEGRQSDRAEAENARLREVLLEIHHYCRRPWDTLAWHKVALARIRDTTRAAVEALDTTGSDASRAARLSFAARLDAALAVKDAGEAVERAWALVRELREGT